MVEHMLAELSLVSQNMARITCMLLSSEQVRMPQVAVAANSVLEAACVGRCILITFGLC